MSYRLWINDEAKAEMKRLPGHMRQRIVRAVQELINNPRPSSSRSMRQPEAIQLELRRIRIDHWRIVYVVDDDNNEIGVLAIRKRPPYDYGDLSGLLAGLDE